VLECAIIYSLLTVVLTYDSLPDTSIVIRCNYIRVL